MVRTPLKQGEIIQLNNRQYTINRVIGDGATCIVYSAYYSDNSEHLHYVNIKECYPHNVDITRQEQKLCWNLEEDKNKSITAFRNAYDKVMLCQNGNFTVHAFDIFENNNTAYIIMDANDGVTFDKDSADTIADILKTVKLLAYVVGEYHKNGYLHLDIKPSNFLVYPRPSEHIVLFDMDTVTSINDIRSGDVRWCSYSDGWAAPEQKQGKINKLSPATDIYAIGAVLFEKITGRQVNNDDIGYFAEWEFEGKLFDDINPKIKRLLTNIFKKTLAANVKRRYQFAGELITALEEAIKIAENKVYIEGHDICCSGLFIGRENELNRIKESFANGKKAVFLQGFGGIGKTEIARKYAELYSKDYDTVLFLKYNGNSSLIDLLNDVNIVNFEPNSSDEKWRKLHTLLDEYTLVIVDNFDVKNSADNNLKVLFETKAKVLITTRTKFKNYTGDKYEHIEVKKLVTDDLEQVFIKCAEISFLDIVQKDILNKIFKLIDYHTYTTELLAKQMLCSGWSIEELYKKVKTGISSLASAEIIETNKDEFDPEDNSFNNLRAVYNITELTEPQKQVLRNFSLLNFVKITRTSYKEITRAETLDPFNELLKLGLIQGEEDWFYIHPLINELVKIELKPDWDNCIEMYNYVLKLVNWFDQQYITETADQAEAIVKGKFLSRFFRSIDLTDEANYKLAFKWLTSVFDEGNDYYIAYIFHPEMHYEKLFKQLIAATDNNDISFYQNDKRYKIWFLFFKCWLNEYRFSFESEKLQHLHQTREENIIESFNTLLKIANKMPYSKSLIANIYTEIAYKIEWDGISLIPNSIAMKFYNEAPKFIEWPNAKNSSLSSDSLFEKYEFEKNNSIGNEDMVGEIFNKSSQEINWNDRLEELIRDFKNSTNKLRFAQSVVYDDIYTPLQKIVLISDFLCVIFNPLYHNIEAAKKHIEVTDWFEAEAIVNLVTEIYEEYADYFCEENYYFVHEESQVDDEELIRYKTIISIILNKGDISKLVGKLELIRYYDGIREVDFDQIINIFAITDQCRYIVPYMIKELLDRMPDPNSDEYMDEVRALYSMIESVSTYSELAAKEVENKDSEAYDDFMKTHHWANNLLDRITHKTFELKDETEE